VEIKNATFIKSSPQETDCPDPDLPEYAFIGRSNVGKSSLINLLTGRKKLAKTSSTPGKTQLINHFLINESWYLVDLPGYGWARTSKKNKADWKKMIDNYLRNRKNLFSVFVLIDSRHEPQQIDLEFINWLGEEAVPFCLVFTKADKLGKTQIQRNISIYNKTLKKTWEELPQMFITSSEEKVGRKEILEFIESINQSTQQ
jgi:GTP-binding protein